MSILVKEDNKKILRQIPNLIDEITRENQKLKKELKGKDNVIKNLESLNRSNVLTIKKLKKEIEKLKSDLKFALKVKHIKYNFVPENSIPVEEIKDMLKKWKSDGKTLVHRWIDDELYYLIKAEKLENKLRMIR